MKTAKSLPILCSLLLFGAIISCDKDECANDENVVFIESNKSVSTSGTTIGTGKETEADLDNDGINDIVITAFYSYFDGKSYRGINGLTLYVKADTAGFFSAGDAIDSTSSMAIDNTVYSNAKDAGWVGYSLEKGDGKHYGWFKAEGTSTLNLPFVSVTAKIIHTAYNKNNQGITAGYTGICDEE
jgi:hypothetical protein